MTDKKFKGSQWWSWPWGFKENIAIVTGLSLVGYQLQLFTGELNFNIFKSPVNYILLALTILVIVLISFSKRKKVFNWLSSGKLSIVNIAFLIIYALIMGIIPQVSAERSSSNTGFDKITHFWPFALIYYFTIINLTAVVLRRLKTFTVKDYPFYLNHLGILILLSSAGFGASDLKRYIMHVDEGNTEWRVYDDNGNIIELPVAIKLIDFNMVEYAPKLAVINKKTGGVLPLKKPEFWQIDTITKKTVLSGWELKVLKYYHDAVRKNDSTYLPIKMPGSCPAVLVSYKKSGEKEIRTSWISCGNNYQLYMTAGLDDTLSVIMTEPEPKSFMSDIVVFTENGKKYQKNIEVNKPLKAGNWMIYQYDYDKANGKASTYSRFELVYDKWIVLSYIGLIMTFIGSICLLWQGNLNKVKQS